MWRLSQSEAATLFGVSRQARGKWLDKGVPAGRAEAISDLSAATDLLVRHLKRDRIQTVVRRRADAMDGRSLIDLVAASETREVLDACRSMFDFQQAQTGLRTELLAHRQTWWRIASPAWKDPLGPCYSRARGGRWNPPGSFDTLYPRPRFHEPLVNPASVVPRDP